LARAIWARLQAANEGGVQQDSLVAEHHGIHVGVDIARKLPHSLHVLLNQVDFPAQADSFESNGCFSSEFPFDFHRHPIVVVVRDVLEPSA
jgi:hypothetical protein